MCSKHRREWKTNEEEVVAAAERLGLLCSHNTCLCHFALWSILNLRWNVGVSGFWDTLPELAVPDIKFNNPCKALQTVAEKMINCRAEFIYCLHISCAGSVSQSVRKIRPSPELDQQNLPRPRVHEDPLALIFRYYTSTAKFMHLIYTAWKTSFSTRVSRLY